MMTDGIKGMLQILPYAFELCLSLDTVPWKLTDLLHHFYGVLTDRFHAPITIPGLVSST